MVLLHFQLTPFLWRLSLESTGAWLPRRVDKFGLRPASCMHPSVGY